MFLYLSAASPIETKPFSYVAIQDPVFTLFFIHKSSIPELKRALNQRKRHLGVQVRILSKKQSAPIRQTQGRLQDASDLAFEEQVM
jgi:hypothetical protein